eukprot:Rhum_TRINITY_DN14773_c7_g1::Rhum_TRINITY_DN14773_c7_g1_i1::g.117233::m.117233
MEKDQSIHWLPHHNIQLNHPVRRLAGAQSNAARRRIGHHGGGLHPPALPRRRVKHIRLAVGRVVRLRLRRRRGRARRRRRLRGVPARRRHEVVRRRRRRRRRLCRCGCRRLVRLDPAPLLLELNLLDHAARVLLRLPGAHAGVLLLQTQQLLLRRVLVLHRSLLLHLRHAQVVHLLRRHVLLLLQRLDARKLRVAAALLLVLQRVCLSHKRGDLHELVRGRCRRRRDDARRRRRRRRAAVVLRRVELVRPGKVLVPTVAEGRHGEEGGGGDGGGGGGGGSGLRLPRGLLRVTAARAARVHVGVAHGLEAVVVSVGCVVHLRLHRPQQLAVDRRRQRRQRRHLTRPERAGIEPDAAACADAADGGDQVFVDAAVLECKALLLFVCLLELRQHLALCVLLHHLQRTPHVEPQRLDGVAARRHLVDAADERRRGRHALLLLGQMQPRREALGWRMAACGGGGGSDLLLRLRDGAC